MSEPAHGDTGVQAHQAQLTRGFLFADLRGYTAFVDRNGAASAADVLAGYRKVVRAAIERYRGAEIRTEGDSFYVVFPSVSAAVECGIAIADAVQREIAAATDPPMAVGVGVHAGETVETPEGYVGSAVNVAARLCALAGPGEVLVSDTVRGLTRNVLPVPFAPAGRRRLKGIAEPVTVYVVRGPTTARTARRAGFAVPAMASVLVLAVAIGLLSGIALLAGRAPAGALTSPQPASGTHGPGTVSPTATASGVPLNARERQLLDRVPPLYRSSCAPGPGIAGRAHLVCAIPDVGPVSYTSFDSADAMDAEYDADFAPRSVPVPGGRECAAGRYERLYYGRTQLQRGRFVCYEEPYSANVAWTDEALAILAHVWSDYTRVDRTLDLDSLLAWWQEGRAGPLP